MCPGYQVVLTMSGKTFLGTNMAMDQDKCTSSRAKLSLYMATTAAQRLGS